MSNYSVIFTNSAAKNEPDINKYVCFDNKIHVRFRDFNKDEFLVGFEKKLTYLLSYLINYSYIPKLIGAYNDKTILKNFLLYDDTLKIVHFIRNHVRNTGEFSGILVNPNYKRQKKNYKYFGDTNIKFFPLQVKNNLTETGNLNVFLESFNIDLYNYLFDDDYIIWLHDKEFKVTKKFEKRKLKKINKQSNKNINIVELW